MKFIEHVFLLIWREEGMNKTGLGQLDNFAASEAHILRVQIFVRYGGLKHGRIVARKRNRQTTPNAAKQITVPTALERTGNFSQTNRCPV